MVASKKTTSLTDEQKKLEAPVKGYQLQELTNKFAEMKDEFGVKLDTIIRETRGVVTTAQLDETKKEMKQEFTKSLDKLEQQMIAEMDSRDESIHAKYGPIKTALWTIAGIVGAGMLAQVFIQLYNFAVNLGGK